MKKIAFETVVPLFGILVLMATLLAPLVSHAGPKDYVAKEREDGKFCATIKVEGVNGMSRKTTKCRTIEQWEKAGYTVSSKKNQEESAS